MIRLDMKQGTPEWIDARLGIPTASAFGRIISVKTQKLLAGSETYMNELLAEWLIGESNDDAVSAFMERGRQMEIDAVSFYEALRDVDTQEVGFCLSDDKRCGASPDRLIGDDGGLEIKCLSATNHIAAMRANSRPTAQNKYYPQIQGALWITGRDWWDFMSYHPTMESVVVRYNRDEIFIKKLDDLVNGFCDRLELERRNFVSAGHDPAIDRQLAVL